MADYFGDHLVLGLNCLYGLELSGTFFSSNTVNVRVSQPHPRSVPCFYAPESSPLRQRLVVSVTTFPLLKLEVLA